MFYDKFVLLCTVKGVSPSKAALEAGISKSLVTKWKVNNIDVPSPEILKKLSTYFGVPVSRLLSEENQNTPTITEKDERDIARDMERIMSQLDSSGDLMFDGDPMSDEARETMLAAMQLGLQAANLKNKARFAPKKYRKE